MDALSQFLQSSPFSVLLIPLLVSSVLIWWARSRRHPYPPGPKGLPIIGNMMMMGKLTHRGLAEQAKKYGGLVHLRLGMLHMVVASTPEMAREVLQVQDGVFANRPANVAISYLTYERADMAFANYGPFWRQMRKVCVMKLFSRRRAESWASVREEVDRTVREVASKVGSPVNVGELVFALTRNITYKAAFGSSCREGQEEFAGILEEFSKLFGAFNIADFIPWLGWVNATHFNKRMERARGSLDVFIDKIISEHLEKNKDADSEAADMVDELIAFLPDHVGDHSKSAFQLTRDNIKALVMDVMFGGTETVASVIEWVMAELMKSTEDLKKVQEELSKVVGPNRRVQESDLEKLTYLKCAVKETLRLHPPIPLLLHEASDRSVVAGYSIPAGCRVWVNAWAIGRDKASWGDPDEFRPSRFLNDAAPDFKGTDFEFIPFGSGRRSCPGMQLGLYAVELCLAHLLHCFEWELPQGMSPRDLDMNDVFGLTAPRAVRLVALPTYTLTCPL